VTDNLPKVNVTSSRHSCCIITESQCVFVGPAIALRCRARESRSPTRWGGDMRVAGRGVLACAVLWGCVLTFGSTRAVGQDLGFGEVLGGFGAMARGSGSSLGGGLNIVDPSGMGGNVIVPAAGGLGASMSPNTRGGGLSFRSRPSAAVESARPSFSLDSMGGGMTRMGGMGRGSGRRPFTLPVANLSGGMGLGGG